MGNKPVAQQMMPEQEEEKMFESSHMPVEINISDMSIKKEKSPMKLHTPAKVSESPRKDSQRRASIKSSKVDVSKNLERTVMLTGPSNVGKTTIMSYLIERRFASWHPWTKKQYSKQIKNSFQE